MSSTPVFGFGPVDKAVDQTEQVIDQYEGYTGNRDDLGTKMNSIIAVAKDDTVDDADFMTSLRGTIDSMSDAPGR